MKTPRFVFSNPDKMDEAGLRPSRSQNDENAGKTLTRRTKLQQEMKKCNEKTLRKRQVTDYILQKYHNFFSNDRKIDNWYLVWDFYARIAKEEMAQGRCKNEKCWLIDKKKIVNIEKFGNKTKENFDLIP